MAQGDAGHGGHGTRADVEVGEAQMSASLIRVMADSGP